MTALLPNEHLPIVTRFGGSRDWIRSQGLSRSLRKAGYSDNVVVQVSQSVADLTRPVGRTSVRHIKGLSADDHSRIQTLLNALPEGYSGAYGAHLLVHLAGLSSGERAEVLTNAESLTPEQTSNLVGLVGDMPARYDAGTAARLTAFVLRFPGTSNVPDDVISNLTELGTLADRASSGTLTSAELNRQTELIDTLTHQASASNLPDPLATVPSTSRRPWLEMVTDSVTRGRSFSDGTPGDYDTPAKVIASRLQGGSSAPVNLLIQTGAPTVGAEGNIVASAYGPVGTALYLRDVLAAASDKTVDASIKVTIATDQRSRATVIASLAAAGIRTSDVNIDTSSSPARQAALASKIGPDGIFVSIGHSDRNGGRASLLEAVKARGTTTFVIDDSTLEKPSTPDQADYVLTAWNPNIGAQALSGSVLRELGLSKLMHGPEQVRAVYQAATAKPADLATFTEALKVDDAIRTSDANKIDATTQAVAAKAAASRAADALKGGDPATAASAAAEAANLAKAAIISAKGAIRGTDQFAARVVADLPEPGDTAESRKAATKARATARAANTASARATIATVAYREAAAAVGIAKRSAADAQAAAATPDAAAKAAIAVTTATAAAQKAARTAKVASTVELAAALRPAAKAKAAATAHTIDAQAQAPSIAILDDDRFVPGATPSTFSINAHEGNWHLLVYSLGPKAGTTAEASRLPAWLETYSARSNPVELDRYNTLFELARPPEEGVADKFALKRFQLSQQTTREKVRTYGGAAAAVTAAGFLYGTAHVGWAPIEDVIAGLTLAGTSIRRVQLVKATLVTRLFQANRAPSYTDADFAPPKALQLPRLRRSTHSDRLDSMLIASQSHDPASLAEAKWRVMKNDRTRFATFTVSTAAAVSGAGHAFLTAHGIPLDLQVTADFVVGSALTAAQWAAARKLLTARFFPDGRLYAHPSPKVYDSKPSWIQKITKNTVGNYFEILSGELALNVLRVDVLAPNPHETSTDSIALDLHALSDMTRALQRQISARLKAAGAARGSTSPAHPPGEGRFSAWVELVASSGAGAGIELGDTYDTIHEGIDIVGQGGSGAE